MSFTKIFTYGRHHEDTRGGVITALHSSNESFNSSTGAEQALWYDLTTYETNSYSSVVTRISSLGHGIRQLVHGDWFLSMKGANFYLTCLLVSKLSTHRN